MDYKYPSRDVIEAVPENSIAFIEGKSITKWLEEYSFLFSRSNTDDTLIKSFLPWIDSLNSWSEQSSEARLFLTEQEFVISLNQMKNGKAGFLLSCQLGKGREGQRRLNLIIDFFKLKKKRILEIDYYYAENQSGKGIYITSIDGILNVSGNREIMELGYYTLDSDRSVNEDEGFNKAREFREKSLNDRYSLFMHYQRFHKWFSGFMHNEHQDLIATLPDLGEWFAGEMSIEEGSLLINGLSIQKEGALSPLYKIKSGNKEGSDLVGLLPSNTVYYQLYKLTSFGEFQDKILTDYVSKRNLDVYDYSVDSLRKDSLQEAFVEYGGGEMLVAATASFDTVFGSNFLVVNGLTDFEGMSAYLNALSKDNNDTLRYQGFYISKLTDKYLFPAAFGREYDFLEECYYTFFGDYLVMASGVKPILSLISDFELRETLLEKDGYKSYLALMPSSSQLQYYMDLSSGRRLFESLSDTSKSDVIDRAMRYLPSSAAFHFQTDGEVVTTSMWFDFQISNISNGGKEILLGDALAAGPFFIDDHRSREKKLLAVDKQKSLYLLNRNAEIEWKMQIEELPLSDFFKTDIFHNSRYQYLFLSENMIHLVQLDGKYVDGYPKRLPKACSSAISFFDYDNNGNYRIIYQTADNHLINIGIDGNRVRGWNNPSTLFPLNKPLKHFRMGGSDIIAGTDTSGVAYFFDRRGNHRIASCSGIEFSRNSELISWSDAKGHFFGGLSKKGHLVTISIEGTCREYDILQFPPEGELLSFNGEDGTSRILVLKSDGYRIYSTDIQLEADHSDPSYEFSDFSVIPNNGDMIAVVYDNAQNEIVVVKNEGQFVRNEEWLGRKSVIGEFTKGETYLITSKGSVLYWFYLEK